MYSQIIKEFFQGLVVCFRELFDESDPEIRIFTKLEHDYYSQTPIWWYTYPCFIYSLLNQALRTHETHVIIKKGVFIRDLHRQIEQLHSDQANNKQMQSFIAYRGQGLSKVDFDKIMKNKGGLISFNSFLSTSKDRDVALLIVDANGNNEDTIGILFEMTFTDLFHHLLLPILIKSLTLVNWNKKFSFQCILFFALLISRKSTITIVFGK
ncbi:unnamed protein product [Adineta ricciae]|uniref:Uncharacterized protein n=1 Tax=Adineta ricciae TaxID=249248 RepID=A0A815VBB0_ADIRI|nr:unnamed protein product [Adineta ricciae]